VRLLIAHGSAQARRALHEVADELADGGLETVECADGTEAADLLLAADAPDIAIIDWDVEGSDGPTLCRRVRAQRRVGLPYIILLARSGHRIASGLDAGANDCVRVPATMEEMQARICVGRRFADLPWDLVTVGGDEQETVSEAECLLQSVLLAQ